MVSFHNSKRPGAGQSDDWNDTGSCDYKVSLVYVLDAFLDKHPSQGETGNGQHGGSHSGDD